MDTAALWPTLPANGRYNVWQAREKNDWDRFKKDMENERLTADQRFCIDNRLIRLEMGNLVDLHA